MTDEYFENDKLVLISGASTTGKSTSLMHMEKPEGVMYLNTEANKKLPFRSKFKEFNVIDPMQIYEAFDHAETMPEIHTIIIDSLTYLMDQYETKYVLTSTNTMKAWGEFAQYFKKLMQHYVAKSSKNVVFLAHTLSTLNEETGQMEVSVPVKGALKNNGIESYFSTIISTKRMKITDLDQYSSPLLNISAQEDALGVKYCFQTQITKRTLNERMRSPLGMFSEQETFIDNDVQQVLTRLHEYYSS